LGTERDGCEEQANARLAVSYSKFGIWIGGAARI
jgi:hypothetical protein